VLVAIGTDVNRIPNRIAEHFTRRAIAGAAHVMTMGGHLRAQVIRLGAEPAKTSCYTNGCDTEIFHLRDRVVCRKELNLDPAAPVIVYVGRLDMLKGLGELLEAAASLRPKYPSLRLVYIGDGPARPLLDARIRELQLAANVIFPGVCDSEAVARWLGACNVFALPSYAEGSPNVIIEALNCGRPVIASKVGGIPELFREDAGLLIPARDAQALAEALDQALSRKWDETAIAQRYRRPWSDLAKEMGDVLEAVGTNAK
jgi:glycosyltransferase involved in cell wall biosynthesis